MENIFKNSKYTEKLFHTIADNMILVDVNGNCKAVYNVEATHSWFITEEMLLGKNIWELIPNATYQQIYPIFKHVLQYHKQMAQDIEMELRGTTYYFRCILSPFEGMVLAQYRDITERNQRKIELEKQNNALYEIQKAALIGDWKYDSRTNHLSYSGHTGVASQKQEQYITPEEFIDYVVAEDKEGIKDWFNFALQGRLHQSIDYRIMFNGRIYYIRQKAFAREHPRS